MIKEKFKENKKLLIISVVLWLIIAIVLVIPFCLGIVAATMKEGQGFSLNLFIKGFTAKIADPFGALGLIFDRGKAGTFFLCELIYTIVYSVVVMIAAKKSSHNHEYYNIEHGSSDWSKGGEQYQILNKKTGIILAENNYLPVDKRGNVNVLVVGRFRFW